MSGLEVLSPQAGRASSRWRFGDALENVLREYLRLVKLHTQFDLHQVYEPGWKRYFLRSQELSTIQIGPEPILLQNN